MCWLTYGFICLSMPIEPGLMALSSVVHRLREHRAHQLEGRLQFQARPREERRTGVHGRASRRCVRSTVVVWFSDW